MQPVVQDGAISVGSRVAARRTALGYSAAFVATHAGMAPSYLEYVESSRGRPSDGVLRRLAEVLRTTVEQLHGEGSLEPELHLDRDRVPEAPTTARVVSRLEVDDCHLLMASVPIGRVAFVVSGPPLVLPVNFALMGREIVIRTAAMSPLAEMARAGRLVSFEVDEIDERSQLGWSVLCQGPAMLSDEEGSNDHHALDLIAPWIGGDRQAVVVITPTTVTGRRIGFA